uniref:C2H2-type domain-containing protein n=1 Tax=Oncorhynchus tshawytscha TaxID=74940 RepID=A0AAZ3R4F7_ONCTS
YCPPLLLPSLRLFIPPLRLVSAAMWQVVQRGDVQDYGMLEEFVTMVTEIVPELLSCSQRAQLILGLRARVRDWVQNGENKHVELSESKFVELVKSLLKDPSERENFYQDVFPVEFGPKYDTAIQMLMLEFLSRLEKLLPIPDLEQTASLLSAVPSALEKCVQFVPDPIQLRTLLQYHRKLGHLDSIRTPSSFGDFILSSLSLPPYVRVVTAPDVDSDTQSEGMNLEGMEARELLENRTKEIDVLVPADEVRRYIITEPDYGMDMESAIGENDNQAVTGLNLLRPSQLKRSKRLQIKNMFSKRRKPRKTDSSGRANKQPSSSKGRPSPKKSCRRGPFSKTCEVCGKTFTRVTAMKRHQLTHTGDLKFKCLMCEKSFRDGHNLKRHQRRVCEKELNMLDEDENEEEIPQPSTSKSQITSLLKTPCPPGPSHQGTLDTITKTFTQLRYLVEHERVHSGEYPYQCSVCQAKFNKANSLTIHSRKHTGEKPFLCWQCGKSYKDRGNLSMHMGTHSEERPFSCSQCDMTYRTKIQLNTHIEQVHEGVRYTCAVCGKQFLKAVSLIRHELTHTGERPWPCSYCTKTFITANERRLHERYHTGERPYKCQDCGKSFVQLCFLKAHQRLHTGEKPFACSVCDKRFRLNYHRQRHEQTHTGKQKPHLCFIIPLIISIANL